MSTPVNSNRVHDDTDKWRKGAKFKDSQEGYLLRTERPRIGQYEKTSGSLKKFFDKSINTPELKISIKR